MSKGGGEKHPTPPGATPAKKPYAYRVKMKQYGENLNPGLSLRMIRGIKETRVTEIVTHD